MKKSLIALILFYTFGSSSAIASRCETDVKYISTKMTNKGRNLASNFRVYASTASAEVSVVDFSYALRVFYLNTSDGRKATETEHRITSTRRIPSGKAIRHTAKYRAELAGSSHST